MSTGTVRLTVRAAQIAISKRPSRLFRNSKLVRSWSTKVPSGEARRRGDPRQGPAGYRTEGRSLRSREDRPLRQPRPLARPLNVTKITSPASFMVVGVPPPYMLDVLLGAALRLLSSASAS